MAHRRCGIGVITIRSAPATQTALRTAIASDSFNTVVIRFIQSSFFGWNAYYEDLRKNRVNCWLSGVKKVLIFSTAGKIGLQVYNTCQNAKMRIAKTDSLCAFCGQCRMATPTAKVPG